MKRFVMWALLGVACDGDKGGNDNPGGGGGDDTGETTDDTGGGGPDDTGGNTDDTGHPPDDTGLPPQGGHCEEVSRVDVKAIEVAADGFDYSIKAVLENLTGTWEGDLELGMPADTATPVETTEMTLVFDNDAYGGAVVSYEWEGPKDSEPEDCPDLYYFKVPTTIQTADGGLDETVDTEWLASFLTEAAMSVRIRLSAVNGTLRPEAINKGDWSSTVLDVQAESRDGSQWTGSVYWGPDAAGEPDTGVHDTGSMPDPTSEMVGRFELAKAR